MRKGLNLVKEIRNRVDNLREDLDVALDPGLAGCDIKQMLEAVECILTNARKLKTAAFELQDVLTQAETPSNNLAGTRDLSEVLR